MPENAIALLILGVVAGMLSGMFGIGGGAVIVPALTVIMGFGLHEAVGTSLAVLVWPVSFFAVLAYYRAKMLKIPLAALIAFGLIFGAIVGAQVALGLPSSTLRRIYGVFLLYVGWRFIEPRKLWAIRQGHPPPPVEQVPELQAAWYVIIGIGLIAGVASGLFGIGGGLVIVPILVELLHYDQKCAVGTSLAALLPPVSLGAVISYYDAGKIDVAVALLIGVGLIFGAFAGARIALGLPSSTVKRMYGIFLIVMGLRFILQT